MCWQRLRHNNNLRAIRLQLIVNKYVLSVSKYSVLWLRSRKSASVVTTGLNRSAERLKLNWKKCMEARLLQWASKIKGDLRDPVSCCWPRAVLVLDSDCQVVTADNQYGRNTSAFLNWQGARAQLSSVARTQPETKLVTDMTSLNGRVQFGNRGSGED